MDLGFYTDYYMPTGRIPKTLSEGDIVTFMAGLAVYPDGFWERRRSLREISRAFRRAVREGRAGIYLVGFIRVEKILDILSVGGWGRTIEEYPLLRWSPHYCRRGDKPVAIIGEAHMVYPPARLTGKPGSSKLREQPPSPLLEKLIGGNAARRLSKGNYRRSHLAKIDYKALRSTLEKYGYEVRRISRRAWIGY